jgi:hypothetical protein
MLSSLVSCGLSFALLTFLVSTLASSLLCPQKSISHHCVRSTGN